MSRSDFFHRFGFNRRDQKPKENIKQYRPISILRNMAKSCDICDCVYGKLFMDRLILGVEENIGKKNHFSEET